MGWISAIFASGRARKALGILLAAITIALFLLNLRRAAEPAVLAQRMRDGQF